MWQIVRPYQRSGYRQIIARPLANVVKALDEVNEQDHKWRIELMMLVRITKNTDALRPICFIISKTCPLI